MEIVSKKHHARLWKPSAVALANARLADAVISNREISIGKLMVQCVQCHLGPGFYHKRNSGLHRHEEVQIEIPLSGSFDFNVGEQLIRLLPAQALVIPRRTPHGWETPRGGFMLGLMLRVKDRNGIGINLPISRKRRLLVAKSAEQTAHLRQLIGLAAAPSPTPLTPTLCSSLLTVLIAGVLDSVCSFRQKAEPDDAGRFRGRLVYERAEAFITSNLGRPLHAAELAMQAGISFRQLTRIFHQQCGKSPHQHILSLRIEHARRLLRENPERQIKEIAYECGFGSSSHFSSLIRKSLKLSPGALKGDS